MQDATAQDATAKTNEKTATRRPFRPSDEPALHRCYGEIGISAVAAAVRYQGGAKNPAYAPAAVNSNDDVHAVAIA